MPRSKEVFTEIKIHFLEQMVRRCFGRRVGGGRREGVQSVAAAATATTTTTAGFTTAATATAGFRRLRGWDKKHHLLVHLTQHTPHVLVASLPIAKKLDMSVHLAIFSSRKS